MDSSWPDDDTAPEDQRQLTRVASVSSLDESSQQNRYSVYRNGNHGSKTLEGFSRLREQGILTDVILAAGNVQVSAHKVVLASNSPYFQAMFSDFDERKKDFITIGEIDPSALSPLIDYIYSSEVDISEDNVQSLLPAANLLQITDVRDFCCDFLQSQLHPTNCLGIQRFADIHDCHELVKVAQNYTESYFTQVLESDEFLELSLDRVIHFISSDTISVSGEEKIFESVLAWIHYKLCERKAFLPSLMEHIRLPLLTQDYLFKVEAHELIKSNYACKDFIIEALKYHLLSSEFSRVSLNSPRTKPREPLVHPKVMLAIGGQAPKAIRSVECYDFKSEQWIQLAEMTSRRCRCGVAVVKGKVYAVGGFNGSLRVKSVEEYDPSKDTWTPISSMETRRSTLGVAVINDYIYAVGGFDGSSGLSTAEVIKIRPGGSDEWRSIASMSTRRSSVGVGVLNGLIYAVGGYDGMSRQCLFNVEVYNPKIDVWSSIPDMSQRRSGAGVGILNGLLYVVGGHDGPLVRKSVEVYNDETKSWSLCAEMNICRRNAGVSTHNGFLYVVGGDDGSSNLNSIEFYNSKNDSWTLVESSLLIGRSYTGVCIIDKPENFPLS